MKSGCYLYRGYVLPPPPGSGNNHDFWINVKIATLWMMVILLLLMMMRKMNCSVKPPESVPHSVHEIHPTEFICIQQVSRPGEWWWWWWWPLLMICNGDDGTLYCLKSKPEVCVSLSQDVSDDFTIRCSLVNIPVKTPEHWHQWFPIF